MATAPPAAADGNESPTNSFAARSISAGSATSCAIVAAGAVKCWGENGRGQLGLGDTADRGDDAGEMGEALPAVNLGAGRTAVAITGGEPFACALLDNGTVKCWGANDNGALGLGDFADRGDNPGEMGDNLPAVNLGSGRTATAITAGDAHACAILDNGAVKCWGWNTAGLLGLGDAASRGDGPGEMGDNLPAVNLGAGRTATAISASNTHTCAILDNGAVKCWGSNLRGGLGLGDTANRGDGPGEMGDNLPAVNLGAGRTATAIATGGGYACAVLDNGAVKCWGYNLDGELGLGDAADRGDGPGEMGDNLPAVDLGTGRTATSVAAGLSHTCARLDNATVKCWGINGDGMLGLGNDIGRGEGPGQMGDNLPPIDLGTGRTAASVTAGFYHTCARLDDGTVKCWGYNNAGQLGRGDTARRGDGPGEMGDSLPAVDLGGSRRVVGVAVGTAHSCALLEGGSVKCWGANNLGQLGLGDMSARGDAAGELGNALGAVPLGSGRTATAIAAGDDHTCALLDDGSVKCWGFNGQGRLGLGNTSNRGDNGGEMGDNLPAVNLGSGRTATAISASGAHTCARLDNATVKCWGYNGQGQLGLGDVADRGDNGGEMGDNLPAVNVGTGRTVTAVSVGSNHTCARLDNATVKCWGKNANGQLGVGDTNDRGSLANQMGDNLPAVSLGVGRTVASIDAGGSHTCARLDNGTVKCWGLNSSGQLGLGDTIARGDDAGEMGDILPVVSLGTGRTATAVTAGYTDACARLDNGTLKCWGLNGFGELGQGDTTTRGDNANEMGNNLAAVNLGTNRTAGAAVVAADYHVCAVLDDASVKCWGRNSNGQLGRGDTASRGDGAGEMGDSLLAAPMGGTNAPTGISGRLSETGTGAPIAGGIVLAMRTTDFSLAGGAVANGRGEFSVYTQPGTYFLYLIDPTANHTAGFNGAPGATPTTVAADAVTTTNPTAATTRGRITGTVTEDTSGLPLNNQIALSLGGPNFSVQTATTTAANGTYSLRNLPNGNHWVGFLDPTGNHRSEFFPNSPNVPDSTAVSTSTGNTANASVSLAVQAPTGTGATITGTVTQSGDATPIYGAMVVALNAADFRMARVAFTDALGAYTLDLQPTLSYRLVFIDPSDHHDTEWHNNQPGTSIGTSTPVAAPGLANADLNASGGTITGTITDSTTTNPLPGALVLAIGPTGIAGAATTAANGTYTVNNLPPGTYRAAFVDPTGNHVIKYWTNSVDYAGAATINVTANATTPNVSGSLNRT